jgi:3-hydroxy-D-aspartate aldolase
MRLEEIDTPALLLDLDVLDRNVRRMAEVVTTTAVLLRPHAKTHKCPLIAHHQIALGAVGVCAAKVSEAEILVNGGIKDILITNEIVGATKLAHLAALAREARIAVCADDPENVQALNDVALDFGIRIPVLVEVNVGGDRCGVGPGEPALTLATQIASSTGLYFAGIQAYYGPAQHIREFERRRTAILGAAEKARRTVELLEANGIHCPCVTGGGTGTYRFEIESGIFTEVQPGSYVFMDLDYGKNVQEDGSVLEDFGQALFVYATVMSRSARDRAILDAGEKAVCVTLGMPQVYGMPDVEYVRASVEHGNLILHDPERVLSIGEKIRLIPGYCDPTVNLFDWYVCIRRGSVEALWPVAARGAVR